MKDAQKDPFRKEDVPAGEEQKEPAKEDYSFMQEVIKDETVGGPGMKNRILRVIGYGVILGVAASIVFCALNPWMEELFQNDSTQVKISEEEEDEDAQDAEGDGEDETQEDASGESEDNVLDEDDYGEVVQNLTSLLNQTKKCLAYLTVTDAAKEQTVAEQTGAILADNGKELLVLGRSLDLKDGEELTIRFSDGNTYPASVKKCDENLGLGVYAVDRGQIKDSSWDSIREISVGNSEILEDGDVVLALGAPFGSDVAVAIGNFASDNAVVELADGRYTLLCTNISCESGGSGILINRRGSLVGILAQDILPEGSKNRIGGYAISDIRSAIERLSNNTSVPYTGLYGTDVTEELQEKGMPQGVYVKEVSANSPAMAAGIQSGDVISKVGDTQITGIDEYHELLMESAEGRTIKLLGYRKGAGDEYVGIEFLVSVGSMQQE